MEKIKFAFVGILLMLGLILVCAESATGGTMGTVIIKLAGMFLLVCVPVFWKFFKLDRNKTLHNFIND